VSLLGRPEFKFSLIESFGLSPGRSVKKSYFGAHKTAEIGDPIVLGGKCLDSV